MKTEFMIVDVAERRYYSLDKDYFVQSAKRAFVFPDLYLAQIMLDHWLNGFSDEWRRVIEKDYCIIPLQTMEIKDDNC